MTCFRWRSWNDRGECDLRNDLERAKVYADEYKELYKEQKEENRQLKQKIQFK